VFVSRAGRMREEREKLKTLLQDTVTMLCRNSLLYAQSLRIEGVIGITVDNNDAFVVHINYTTEPAHDSMSQDTGDYYPIPNVKSEYRSTKISEPPVMSSFSDMSSGFDVADYTFDASVEFKAEMKAEEDEWGAGDEESYSGLGYPWGDAISSSNSYQPQLSIPQLHSQPRMSLVLASFHFSVAISF